MRIRVNDPHEMAHRKAGFFPSEPGEYDFPDDPDYAGWLKGKKARGAWSEPIRVDPYPPEALGVTAGSGPAGEGENGPNPLAEGLTAGSTPGEPEVSTTHPDAEGLTIGSTPGPPPEVVDEKKDQQDAQVTQRGQEAGDVKPKRGKGK